MRFFLKQQIKMCAQFFRVTAQTVKKGGFCNAGNVRRMQRDDLGERGRETFLGKKF